MEAIARSLGAVRFVNSPIPAMARVNSLRAPHCLPSPRHVQALRRLSGFRSARLAPRLPQNVRTLATATGGKVAITKEGLELAPEGVWGVKRWVLSVISQLVINYLQSRLTCVNHRPSFWLR